MCLCPFLSFCAPSAHLPVHLTFVRKSLSKFFSLNFTFSIEAKLLFIDNVL